MSAPAEARPGAGSLVKCVVWDLDNTLLRGIYLESRPEPPSPDPAMTRLLTVLGQRGILHAIASRNPPEAAQYAAQVTGCAFVAAECGWGRKSEALARIAAGLDIGVDALAFVDDDPYERAEVGAALPGVRVLSPEDAAEAVDWPEFSPAEVTAEAAAGPGCTSSGSGGWRRNGPSVDRGRSSAEAATQRSPSPPRPRPTCRGCTSCPSGPASSTRPARR